MPEPTHLGDGAYVSPGTYAGEVVVTADHHDPRYASAAIYLDPNAVAALVRWLTVAGYVTPKPE